MGFKDPWVEEHSETFLHELQKEISINHTLFSVPLRVIARRLDRDDLLFMFEGSTKVVQVHLTWKGKSEDDPNWPKTKVFAIIQDWMNQIMIPDSEEFN
ncbi:hypothetical protein SAMN04487897_1512 [Paenibacillus sp. yr247]|uniref:hypothetical protein n=1 Tax=Paenibacillus sp. yr247 TaxID=1761880 RepID=UPI00088A4DF2|nr:hypothetical protein [Paenibacillus sp. yr247]SDP22661.1 hypothetical protein SAMN04487897_1512 [Paenibacillus sp. yr247]